MEQARQIVDGFFAAVKAGDLPDSLLTEDMTAWFTTGGTVSKETYQGMIRMLRDMVAGPVEFVIDSVTAQDERVVAEVRSKAPLVNGDTYEQTYVYVFRLREGRIAAVAEHYNALIAQEKLVPLMKQIALRKVAR